VPGDMQVDFRIDGPGHGLSPRKGR
jgi:hypothetical protein